MSASFQISTPDLPVPSPPTSVIGESQMTFALFAALTELFGMLLSRLLLTSVDFDELGSLELGALG